MIKSRGMILAGHVRSMEEKGHVYLTLVENLKVRRKWKDNIKIDLGEIGWGMDWIHLIQDRRYWRVLIYSMMTLRFPYNVENFLSG
jgi:hypothetical protein